MQWKPTRSPSPSEQFIHKTERGFSALNLLGILFLLGGIFGFLATFVWPSASGCGNNAKQAEARRIAGAMNRAQQAYFLDKQSFAHSLDKLELGIKSETTNYRYSSRSGANAAFNYAVSRQGTPNTKSYVGAVFTVKEKDEIITQAILCEANFSGKEKPADPILKNGAIACAPDTTEIK